MPMRMSFFVESERALSSRTRNRNRTCCSPAKSGCYYRDPKTHTLRCAGRPALLQWPETSFDGCRLEPDGMATVTG